MKRLFFERRSRTFGLKGTTGVKTGTTNSPHPRSGSGLPKSRTPQHLNYLSHALSSSRPMVSIASAQLMKSTSPFVVVTPKANAWLHRRFFSFATSPLSSDASTLYSSSSSSSPSELARIVEGAPPKLVLPLSNGELCSFPLHGSDTVASLVRAIRVEDPSCIEIKLLDTTDTRISHTTSLANLLRSPFVIWIDSRTYVINPSSSLEGGILKVLNASDLHDLTTKAYYQKIRQRLAEERHHHMLYVEFQSWCSEYGLTTAQAAELARALHVSGEILHFSSNPGLKDIIFLSPDAITGALADSLDIRYVQRGTALVRQELEALLPEYLPLNNTKLELDRLAEAKARQFMVLGAGYLLAQWAFLARLVWVDFNWDIMEPISYFVGLATIILGVTFFSLFRAEYTYNALQDRQRRKALRKLYIDREFNWKKWNDLHTRVEKFKEILGERNLPAELLNVKCRIQRFKESYQY